MVRSLFFRLQPVELLKPFFILVTVKILTFEKVKNKNIKYILSFLILVSVIILLIDQPDLGQTILLAGSWVATVFVSGVSLFYMFGFFFNLSNFIKFYFIFLCLKIWIYN